MATGRKKLREKIVRWLSPYFKSRVRARLYQLGVLKLRRSEKLILQLIQQDHAKTFLQIGANDGQYTDPLNLAVHRSYLRETLVEPQPAFFKAVRRTYCGISGLEFVNCAISDKPGILSMYAFHKNYKTLPPWVHGSASLDRDKVLRLAVQVLDIENYIVEIPVKVITVAMLFDRIFVKNPDIVVVDAEGHDAIILRQFDFTELRPKPVLYENESLSTSDAAEIR